MTAPINNVVRNEPVQSAGADVRNSAFRRRYVAECNQMREELARGTPGEPFLRTVEGWLQDHRRNENHFRQGFADQATINLYHGHIQALEELVESLRQYHQEVAPNVAEAQRLHAQEQVQAEEAAVDPAAERRARLERIREQELARRDRMRGITPQERQRRAAGNQQTLQAIAQQFNEEVHAPFAAAVAQQQERVTHIDAGMRERLEEIQGRVEHLEEEIVALENHANQLQQEIDQVGHLMDAAELEDKKLGKMMDETRAEIKKNKKKWIKDVCKALVIVAVCVVANAAITAAMKGTLAASGTTAAATSSSSIGTATAAKEATTSSGFYFRPQGNNGIGLQFFKKF